jgi:4-hydroxy-3-polyprenylbenzoate decarboxylase
MPVLTNAFGSNRRICLALNCASLDELAARLESFVHFKPPRSLADKLKLLPRAYEAFKFLPRRALTAPCQQVVLTGSQVDLSKLPVLKCWPLDGGPFVTLPVVFTKDPHTGARNVGMYRLQIFDQNTTGMHWHIHKDGAHFYHEYARLGRRMEVAVAIGTDPAVTYAATAPMPRGVDELLLAGFIRRKPVRLTKCVTVDIEVPAEAEIVLEGYVEPGELRKEGPFGDHTGYYSLEGDYPVLHVTAITQRFKPTYSATIVGRPPMEDCYLAKATERIFLPMLKTLLPEMRDYWLPWEGVFHNIVAVAIDKEFPRQARKVMDCLWGAGQMSFAKSIVIVDEPELLRTPAKLLRAILDTIELKQDLTVTSGVLDVLDHSAPQALFGAKLGMDATARLDGEEPRPAVQGAPLDFSALFKKLNKQEPGFKAWRAAIDGVRNPLMLLSVDKRELSSAHYIGRLEAALNPGRRGLIALFDADIDLNDDSLTLWKAFNNVDPGRDLRVLGSCAIVDATRKGLKDGHDREWPSDITMSPEIKQRVSQRLNELGLNELA